MFKLLVLVSVSAAVFATPINKGAAIFGQYFQGDIKLTDEQREFLANPSPSTGHLWTQYRWHTNLQGYVEVPYYVEPSAGFTQSEIDFIRNEFAIIEQSTCIRFVPRTTQLDYIAIISSGGCWSYVGRIGGRQEMSLDRNGCIWEGIPVHEAIHALGFHHMHNNADRDNYVSINWDNIEPSMAHNFNKVDPVYFSNFNTPYDLLSVMHYPRWAFSMNEGDAIIPHNENYIDLIGASQVSPADITRLLHMYECINH